MSNWPTKKLGEIKIKISQDFIESLGTSYKKFADSDDNKTQAVQRFNEFFIRLESRFLALLKVEAEIFYAEPEKIKRPMPEIQLDMVDKVESFYQQLYACLSAFVMLLNYVAPHSYQRNMSITSIKNFLEFLSSGHLVLKESLAWLEKARDFRARFVDHIQQHVLHDWMTYSYPGKFGPECVIIYFVRKGPEVYYPGIQLDPYAPDFQPPVNYKSFYVSPPHKECLLAFQLVTEEIIKSIAAKYEN
jgi:hypothetical protein